MILWVVGVLFVLTALLIIVRFLRKKDPFGDLDAEVKTSALERARASLDEKNPEGPTAGYPDDHPLKDTEHGRSR